MTADQVALLRRLSDPPPLVGLEAVQAAIGAALGEATDPGPEQLRALADRIERSSPRAQAVIDAARAAAPLLPEGEVRGRLEAALKALDAAGAV
jgi:hypothetical protein